MEHFLLRFLGDPFSQDVLTKDSSFDTLKSPENDYVRIKICNHAKFGKNPTRNG